MAMLQLAEDELSIGVPAYWTPLPNELLVRLIWTRSSAAQSVVLYVLRHTAGYHETAPKAITLEEFQHGRKRRDGTRIDIGTGLSRSAVIDGLKRAVAAGLLREEVDARDRARIVKRYAIALEARSPETTAGEQAVQSELMPLARKRLMLIKGQGQESPKTPTMDEPEETCSSEGSPKTPSQQKRQEACSGEQSPKAPSTDERPDVMPTVQRSPKTPPENRQTLPPWKPKATAIRERNLERETRARNYQTETFQASLGRPGGAHMQEDREESQIEGLQQPEPSVIPNRTWGEASPIVTEHGGDEASSVEATSDSAGSLSDQPVVPIPPGPGMAEPVLQVEPEQLASWQADVAEQGRAVARAQADYERVSAELERFSPGARIWCDLRREQRFVLHRLEAEQQKLAEFLLFVRLIEQGYSKDEACVQVYNFMPCPSEQEVTPDVEADPASQDESTLREVSVAEPTTVPELSPKAWRAALFTGLLTLFGWDLQRLNKNSRGLANKAAMLLQESGIRPEQLSRLKQLFERAYPKVTHYTPIALANHATELSALL